MRCAIIYAGVLVICGSGCGVSQSDFDAVQQRRIAAEREATQARGDLDKLIELIDDAEAERKKWRGSAVDYSTGLGEIVANPKTYENLRIRYDGMVNPTPFLSGYVEQDLNDRKAYGIAVGATPTKHAAFQAEVAALKKKQDTQRAKDMELIRQGKAEDAFRSLKEKYPQPENRDVGGSGVLNTSFFAVSEQVRDDLLKRGTAAGLSLVGNEPLWNARVFFIVCPDGPKHRAYGQVYRIELYGEPDLSVTPVAVVEDEELMANPKPAPPDG